MDAILPRLLNSPLFSIVAFEFSLLALFSIPLHRYRNRVALCLLFVIALTSVYAAPLASDATYARLWIFAWVLWLATFAKFVATTVPPESRYWRHSQGFKEAEDLRLGSHKIAWSVSLIHNLRGVGWNWQITGVTSQKESGRLRFALAKGFQATALLLVSDILQQAMLRLYPAMSTHALPKDLTISHPEWLHDCANKIIFGLSAFVTLQLNYVALSAVAVACRWSAPEVDFVPLNVLTSHSIIETDIKQDWPPIFGDFRDSFTVRHFWGRSWHQLIRSVSASHEIPENPTDTSQSFTTCSIAVIETLKIERGSILSSYIQVWMAFGISGLCHAHGILMFPNMAHATVFDRTAGTIAFFIWQAAAVCAEDSVQHFGRGFMRTQGDQWKRHLIGYAWVFWSFWMSVRWIADDLFRAGLIRQPTAMMSPPRSPGGLIVSFIADKQARGKLLADVIAYGRLTSVRTQG